MLSSRLFAPRRALPLSHAPSHIRGAARALSFLLAAAAFCAPLQVGAQTGARTGDPLGKQRALFAVVESELKAGRRQSLRRHREALGAYPLYPYLLYQDLRNRLASADEDEIRGFLDAHGGTAPVAEKLRHRWLSQLARRGKWARFLEYYRESAVIENKDNRCRRAAALIHEGRERQAAELVESLWLVDFSQPPACDFAFKWGLEQGVIEDDLIWKRILLVWRRGQGGLVNHLGGKLKGEAKRWLGPLKRARSRPERTAFEMIEHVEESPVYAGDVIAFAVRRLSVKDPVKAGEAWDRIRRDCRACRARRDVGKEIGVAAAADLEPDAAYRRLAALPRGYHDRRSRYWRVRAALRLQDWEKVLASVDALAPEERFLPQWSYWRARAAAELGRHGEAREIWERLSREDGYYNYLSADRLGRPYAYRLRPLTFPEAEMTALGAYPAVARMRELLMLNREFDANREMLLLLDRLDDRTKLKLGVAADRWQWPMGAIRSLAEDAERHWLQRFPLPYRELVGEESRRSKVPEEWIYGIMRRESAFVKDVKSPAGALGLMQVRPRTAQIVAARLGLGGVSARKMLSAQINLRLGSAYIKQLYRANRRNLALGLAGYNAGPTLVQRWLKTAPVSDADVWVDTIPFEETRVYVRVVLFYTLVYRHRLRKPPMRLRELMQAGVFSPT